MRSGRGWTETVLYSFCPQSGCADGADPAADVIMDAAGNLYGTTVGGGSLHNAGVVFQLTPSGSGWAQHVLYSFCAQSGCADGSSPYAGLIMDGKGNLFGTTSTGGAYSGGTAFALTPMGSSWVQSALYSFCPLGGGC